MKIILEIVRKLYNIENIGMWRQRYGLRNLWKMKWKRIFLNNSDYREDDRWGRGMRRFFLCIIVFFKVENRKNI